MAGRKSFLEKRAESWATQGLTMDAEALESAGITGHVPSASPVTDDAINVGVQAVELTRTVGSGASAVKQTVGQAIVETASPDFYVTLWVPDGRRPGYFRPRTILQNMKAPCLAKRDRNGHRVFFTKEELDLRFPQWKPYTVDDLPIQCFVENCPKRFDSAQIFRGHMMSFHSEDYEVFKEEIDDLVKEEAAARREQRVKRQAETIPA